MKQFILGLIVVMMLCSCAGMQNKLGENGTIGTAVGGATGAVAGQAIGKNTESTILGSAVGAVFGYAIGSGMDNKGGPKTTEKGVENKQAGNSTWKNPEAGN